MRVWMPLVVVLALIAGAVGLGLAGWDTAAIAGLLAAIAATAAPLLGLAYHTDQQNRKLDQISEQTNGGLDRRIEAGVLAALARAGVTSDPKPPKQRPFGPLRR